MSADVVEDAPGWGKQECELCGCEYSLMEAIKEVYESGVKVTEYGMYCAACMKKVSKKAERAASKKRKAEIKAVLERIDDGKAHEGHESIIEQLVAVLRKREPFRKDEYTYDLAILAMSLVLIGKTELDKLTLALNHEMDGNGPEFAHYAGKFDSMYQHLNSWVNDMNELCSDFGVYSVESGVLHKMDDDANENT